MQEIQALKGAECILNRKGDPAGMKDQTLD